MYSRYSLERLQKVKEFLSNREDYIEQGKIEKRDYKTSDFYNPMVDGENTDLKATAFCLMDQIRSEEISDIFNEKKESVKGVGIQIPVLVIPMNDPSSQQKERLIDGITRVTAKRDIEKEQGIESPQPDVPVHFVACPKLADFVRAHKEEIQNMLNDPLPHDANSKKTAKDWIRGELKRHREAGNEITEDFLKIFRPYVQEQYKNNRTRKTINGWISEVVNEIDVDNSPITNYREKGLRETKTIADLKKINKELVDPERFKRYGLNISTSGMLEKLIGTELLRQTIPEQKNIEASLVMHSEKHTSEEKLLKSIISVYDKLKRLDKLLGRNVFHTIFVMDQVKNEGMLSEDQIRERYNRYSKPIEVPLLKVV